MRVRADLGGELVRCSDICRLLQEEYQCILQTTRGYAFGLMVKLRDILGLSKVWKEELAVILIFW